MKILEANFISAIPVNNFIMMQTEKKKAEYKFNEFVTERSKSATSRLIRNSNYKT